MIEFKVNGKRFIRKDSGWTDAFCQPVPAELGERLEKLYADSLDLGSCSLAELVTKADGYKSGGAYYLAARYYRTAVLQADLTQCRIIYPDLAYCFRRLHQPADAIRVLTYIKDRFGDAMMSPVFLTPAAEAYCDMGQYEIAAKCARLAASRSYGTISPALAEVTERIERERQQ